MDDLCESIECLCNAPQRSRILGLLDGTEMDVCGVMRALDSPRSTVQRNLTELKEQGWVEETRSRYTTTTVGGLLYEVVVTMNETASTIERMAPFFEVVDVPPVIDIRRLSDVFVTTPEPGQPNLPTKRLFEAFEGADSVQGFMPVVSCFVVELFSKAERSIVDHEYIVPPDVFDALDEQYPDDWVDESEKNPIRLRIRLFEDDIPYGLFISDERLAIAVYDEVSRIQVLVESTTDEAVEWGEQMFETYKQQSTESETDMPVAHTVELDD